MIPAKGKHAWEEWNRQDAATWWIQALQMRGAGTSREKRGEMEKQRPKERQKEKRKSKTRAEKQI